MDNLIELADLARAEPLLKTRIFTELQLKILKKRLQDQPLSSNEKTYYYKFIKPKIRAMLTLFAREQTGILKARIKPAEKILQAMSRKHRRMKIMISGSFLFNERYNDIDIFIVSKYAKEDYKNRRKHINYVQESALDSMFFASLQQGAIANFRHEPKTEFKLEIEEVLLSFELLVNSIAKNEDYKKELRDFLLITDYCATGRITGPKQLHEETRRIMESKIFKILPHKLINALTMSYDRNDISRKVGSRLREYEQLAKSYASANIDEYIQAYNKVIETAT